MKSKVCVRFPDGREDERIVSDPCGAAVIASAVFPTPVGVNRVRTAAESRDFPISSHMWG